MIKFAAKLKVLKIENKSVQKRDGGTFDFVEAILEDNGKKKTQLVARVDNEVHIRAGQVADMTILVTSHEYNGRIFNSFVITDVLDDVAQPSAPQSYTQDAGDDIPF